MLGLSLLCAALVAWVWGLFRFADTLPRSIADGETHTDAIVVLTGGSGRLAAGLVLLAEDRARKLFVSGVYRGVDVEQLLEISRQTPEELRCCIEIGHVADSTAGNAAETAAWMKRNDFHSLRVVTSGYHLPRSLLEFRHALPEVRLLPHPVFAEHVKRDRWWSWPGTARLIVGEYSKYLVARVRVRFESTLGLDPAATP